MAVELHMLPVKAGDATLIIDRSTERVHTVLIDAGLADEEVVSYLQRVGVYHLDLVILSHPDLDHLKGLLKVIENSFVSIKRIWCFDLSFLRTFVTTGRLPSPDAGTHAIVYFDLLRTLDVFDRILKVKGIDAYQVSEDYRLNLGNLHVEVLYPPEEFYRSLSCPRALKQLLRKKVPDDWQKRNECEPSRAKACKIASPPEMSEQVKEANGIEQLLDRYQREHGQDRDIDANPPKPLASLGAEEDRDDQIEVDRPEEEDRDGYDRFPLGMVGTLYNNMSLVVKIHCLGGVSPLTMLFPGDLSDWSYLLSARLYDLEVDVFKYPHHGSSGIGISKSLKDRFEDFPCPFWNWRCWRRCPAFRRPERYESLYEAVKKGQTSSELLGAFVRPHTTLIFPYPHYSLPKDSIFVPALGKVCANREDQVWTSLASKANLAKPFVLKLGHEKGDVTNVTANYF